jgi:hypothetical protein
MDVYSDAIGNAPDSLMIVRLLSQHSNPFGISKTFGFDFQCLTRLFMPKGL